MTPQRTFRVAVTGTHSTGKSTFLEALRDRLIADRLSVARVADMASAAQELGFRILNEHTFESTLWIITNGVRRELEVALDHQVILVDRPVLDALGYLEAALCFRKDVIDLRHRELLEHFTRSYTAEYDVIVATKLNPEISLGPGRDSNQVFRSLVATEIDRLVRDLAPKALTLSHDNTAELVDVVHQRILKYFDLVEGRNQSKSVSD
jgi:predicted YcjX-like family ATPase